MAEAVTRNHQTDEPRPGADREELGGLGLPGSPTGLSCPRCGGVLGEDTEEGQIRLECRIGHVLRLDTLLEAKAAAVEDALWAAVRALEEKAALSHRMSDRARHHENPEAASGYERVARAASRRAGIVREILASDREEEHDAEE